MLTKERHSKELKWFDNTTLLIRFRFRPIPLFPSSRLYGML